MPVDVVDILVNWIANKSDEISGMMNGGGGWEKAAEASIVDSMPLAAHSPRCYDAGLADIVIHDETGQGEDAIIELKCMKAEEVATTFVTRVRLDCEKITTWPVKEAFKKDRFWSIALAKHDQNAGIAQQLQGFYTCTTMGEVDIWSYNLMRGTHW